MFCGNCGNEIENDSSFCPYCGGKLEEKMAANTVAPVVYQTAPANGLSEEQKQTLLILLLSAAVVIVVIVGAVLLFAAARHFFSISKIYSRYYL